MMKSYLIFTVFIVLTSISGCKLQNTLQSDTSHNIPLEAFAKKTSQQATNFGAKGAIALFQKLL